MVYRVSLTASAEADAYGAVERIREIAPSSAAQWLTKLFDAIFSLEEMPARCPVIDEAAELGFPVRQLLYGRGNGAYRIIFDIRDEHVRILRIWHTSRKALTADDVVE